MNFVLYVHDTSDTPVWPFPTSEAQVAGEINALVETHTSGLVTVDALAGVFVPLAAVQTALAGIDLWIDALDRGDDPEDTTEVGTLEAARDALSEALREAGQDEDEVAGGPPLTLPIDGSCPVCGTSNDHIQQWADDGEAADADWWECETCGADGAFLDPSDPTKTANGITVKGTK